MHLTFKGRTWQNVHFLSYTNCIWSFFWCGEYLIRYEN
jgi:hypothetical protein